MKMDKGSGVTRTSGGQGTVSGKTKGSRGGSGAATGVKGPAGTKRSAGSAWPGNADSTLPPLGNPRSAK